MKSQSEILSFTEFARKHGLSICKVSRYQSMFELKESKFGAKPRILESKKTLDALEVIKAIRPGRKPKIPK